MRTVYSIGEALRAQGWTGTVPIPLRDGLHVTIQNLPADLTQAEAEKISRVVMSYAKELSHDR